LHFSEWIKIESFMDCVLQEQDRYEALKGTIFFIMREARKAFGSPALMSESSVPANLDDAPREEVLKIIKDSLKSIRLYGIIERKQMVDLLKKIGPWMDDLKKYDMARAFFDDNPNAKNKQCIERLQSKGIDIKPSLVSMAKKSEDLKDIDLEEFSDVLSHQMRDKDTLQIAASLLRKLNYITNKTELEILEGIGKNVDSDEYKSAFEFLENKVDEASRETGNDVGGQASTISLQQAKSEHDTAQENLRRAAMALYKSNLDSATIRDAGTSKAKEAPPRNDGKDREVSAGRTGDRQPPRRDEPELYGDKKSPIKSFEQDELFNDFYIELVEKAKKRRKTRDGSFLPWTSEKGDAFDSALNDDEGETHLDRYLQSMIKTKSSQIRQKRGTSLNPRSAMDSVPNRHRKRIILAKDLKLYQIDSSAKDSSLVPNEDALRFYKEHMPIVDESSEDDLDVVKSSLEKDDVIRLQILQDIKYHSDNSTRARDYGISMNPDKLYDSLSGYFTYILNSKRERAAIFASQLAKDDGSSDDAVASMSKAVGNVRRERPGEDSDSMDVTNPDSQDSDSGLSSRSFSAAQTIASGGLTIMQKFFRPYIIRSIRKLASGGLDRSIVQSVLLCIKYEIPCSFTFENGEIKEVSIDELESIDEDFDQKIKEYLFEKLGQDSGSFMPSFGWKSWSDEGHVDKEGRAMDMKKTLRKDSFCSMFFNSISTSSVVQYKIPDILTHLPETSSGGKKIFRFNPNEFPSSWNPPDPPKYNSLTKVDKGQVVPIYKHASIGEYLTGNPRAKRGAVSYLCDMVFEMITKDDVTLKDIMIRRNKEEKEKIATIQAQREKDDEKYRIARSRISTSKSLPLGRPSLTANPNPLGRFVRKQPEESSPP